jgi:hypothetical protein
VFLLSCNECLCDSRWWPYAGKLCVCMCLLLGCVFVSWMGVRVCGSGAVLCLLVVSVEAKDGKGLYVPVHVCLCVDCMCACVCVADCVCVSECCTVRVVCARWIDSCWCLLPCPPFWDRAGLLAARQGGVL